MVLKPVASAGTDNVYFCDSPAELRAAHDAILAAEDRYGRRNTVALAQQFLKGDEHFVNTVSRHGVHHIVEVWRYHDHPNGGGRSIPPAFEHPLPPDDPTARLLGEYVLKVLDALEIHNGSAHTEVMLTERGPVLVECGARLGGAHLPDVVNRAIGTDQVDRLALAIARPELITGHALPPYRLLTHLRYINLTSPRDGVVPGEEGFAEVRNLPSFLDMVLTIPPGRPVRRTVDLTSVPGYLYLSSDDAAQIEADYRRLRELEENGLYDV